jgi:hypothetical protein
MALPKEISKKEFILWVGAGFARIFAVDQQF